MTFVQGFRFYLCPIPRLAVQELPHSAVSGRGSRLCLGSHFTREASLRPSKITVTDGCGGAWQCCLAGESGRYYLGTGWEAVAADLHLQDGQICLFTAITATELRVTPAGTAAVDPPAKAAEASGASGSSSDEANIGDSTIYQSRSSGCSPHDVPHATASPLLVRTSFNICARSEQLSIHCIATDMPTKCSVDPHLCAAAGMFSSSNGAAFLHQGKRAP